VSHGVRDLFPNASPDFLARNTGSSPIVERDPRHAALDKGQVQKPTSQRFLVRVTSIRKRLLDEDNLCEKYHIDLCRYAGILSGDEAGTTKIETTQRKAQKDEEERTLIQVFNLPCSPSTTSSSSA